MPVVGKVPDTKHKAMGVTELSDTSKHILPHQWKAAWLSGYEKLRQQELSRGKEVNTRLLF